MAYKTSESILIRSSDGSEKRPWPLNQIDCRAVAITFLVILRQIISVARGAVKTTPFKKNSSESCKNSSAKIVVWNI